MIEMVFSFAVGMYAGIVIKQTYMSEDDMKTPRDVMDDFWRNLQRLKGTPISQYCQLYTRENRRQYCNERNPSMWVWERVLTHIKLSFKKEEPESPDQKQEPTSTDQKISNSADNRRARIRDQLHDKWKDLNMYRRGIQGEIFKSKLRDESEKEKSNPSDEYGEGNMPVDDSTKPCDESEKCTEIKTSEEVEESDNRTTNQMPYSNDSNEESNTILTSNPKNLQNSKLGTPRPNIYYMLNDKSNRRKLFPKEPTPGQSRTKKTHPSQMSSASSCTLDINYHNREISPISYTRELYNLEQTLAANGNAYKQEQSSRNVFSSSKLDYCYYTTSGPYTNHDSDQSYIEAQYFSNRC